MPRTWKIITTAAAAALVLAVVYLGASVASGRTIPGALGLDHRQDGRPDRTPQQALDEFNARTAQLSLPPGMRWPTTIPAELVHPVHGKYWPYDATEAAQHLYGCAWRLDIDAHRTDRARVAADIQTVKASPYWTWVVEQGGANDNGGHGARTELGLYANGDFTDLDSQIAACQNDKRELGAQ